MNIAHLTTVHPRDDMRIFRKMCCSLAAFGHSVSLHVSDGDGDDCCHGVNIIDIGTAQNRRQCALSLATPMWMRALKGGHDLSNFHDPELIIGALARKLGGKTALMIFMTMISRLPFRFPRCSPSLAAMPWRTPIALPSAVPQSGSMAAWLFHPTCCGDYAVGSQPLYPMM